MSLTPCPPHLRRCWTGHPLKDARTCSPAACRLTSADTIAPACDQYALTAARTTRHGAVYAGDDLDALRRGDRVPARPRTGPIGLTFDGDGIEWTRST